ncbi:MAG: hypothetical protein CSA66_00255 [Proteobacteria bacterium]|nr:MAG: hypothetical protein CSA66_00255 [Pseudomonadota bacterium]
MSVEVAPAVRVGAHAAFDVMTCASVDVVSAATPRGYFQETRQEYGAQVAGELDALTLSAGGTYSRENDYSSVSGSLGASLALAGKDTTLAASYAFTDSNVGRAKDPGFERDLDAHLVTLTATQTLSAVAIGQLAYTLAALDGFQSSPYRTVRVADGTRSPERTPDERLRHAIVARARLALTPTWFLSGDYRLYVDSWGISAHAVQAGVSHRIAGARWLSIRLRDRVSLQSGASFYRDVYDERRAFMTADRELGGAWSNLVGLKLTARPALDAAVRLAMDIKLDWMFQRFDDFERRPQRSMWVVEAGVSAGF